MKFIFKKFKFFAAALTLLNRYKPEFNMKHSQFLSTVNETERFNIVKLLLGVTFKSKLIVSLLSIDTLRAIKDEQ